MRSPVLKAFTLISLSLIGSRASECELGFVEERHENGSLACISCLSNCSICYMSQSTNQTKCTFCKEGFYVDDEGNCPPCAANCLHCFGLSVEQCRAVVAGHRYDDNTKAIVPCSNAGCSICDALDKCASCNERYYEVVLQNDVSPEMIQRHVECRPCNIEHCLSCKMTNDQVKNADYLTCTTCEKGYTVVSGHCEKCPDNCEFCEEESRQCQLCVKGYFIDPSTLECAQFEIKGCLTYFNSTACDYCNSGYYLNHDDNSCISCNDITSHCSYCYTDFDGAKCSGCDRGYYLDKSNKCLPCPALCNYCSEGQCYGCEHGFYWNDDSKQCLKCEQPNCSYCSNNGKCSVCREGFVIDHQKQECIK